MNAIGLVTFYALIHYGLAKLPRFAGKDAKRAVLLAEETQSDIESAFYKEAVAKKYASFFQSTLHHNNGYFLQVGLALQPSSPFLSRLFVQVTWSRSHKNIRQTPER